MTRRNVAAPGVSHLKGATPFERHAILEGETEGVLMSAAYGYGLCGILSPDLSPEEMRER